MNEHIANELQVEEVESTVEDTVVEAQKEPPIERPVEQPAEVPQEEPREKPLTPPQELPVEQPAEIPQPPSEQPVEVPSQPPQASADFSSDEDAAEQDESAEPVEVTEENAVEDSEDLAAVPKEQAPAIDLYKLQQIIEGALLALGKPVPLERLESLFLEQERPDRASFDAALQAIAENCAERGFELKKVASGYRFQVKQDIAAWVGRLWDEKPQRYSRALMETLSIIAYRQPITRGDIEKIRGVAVSTQIVQTLLEHEWIRVVGHRDVPGRPAMYATTKQFLDYFNLESLDQLPPLSEIRDLEEINRGLSLEEDKPVSRIIEFPDPEPGEEDASEDDEAAAAAAIGTRPISEILSEVDARLSQHRPEDRAEYDQEELVLTSEADFDAAEAAPSDVLESESNEELSADFDAEPVASNDETVAVSEVAKSEWQDEAAAEIAEALDDEAELAAAIAAERESLEDLDEAEDERPPGS